MNRINAIKTPGSPMKFNNCDRKVKNQPNGLKNSTYTPPTVENIIPKLNRIMKDNA